MVTRHLHMQRPHLCVSYIFCFCDYLCLYVCESAHKPHGNDTTSTAHIEYVPEPYHILTPSIQSTHSPLFVFVFRIGILTPKKIHPYRRSRRTHRSMCTNTMWTKFTMSRVGRNCRLLMHTKLYWSCAKLPTRMHHQFRMHTYASLYQ